MGWRGRRKYILSVKYVDVGVWTGLQHLFHLDNNSLGDGTTGTKASVGSIMGVNKQNWPKFLPIAVVVERCEMAVRRAR